MRNVLHSRFITISLIVLVAFAQSALAQEEKMRLGTTYSPRQSEYLEMDWKKTYLAVLDEGFTIIRLGAYWDEIEKEKDEYDFSRLDWQIKEAEKRNLAIVLTVGMKAPRWPEYFIPEWIERGLNVNFAGSVSRDSFLKKRTLKFIEKIVTRYNDSKAVKYWQVENEPLNRIGEKEWRIGKQFLREEVELVRKLDKRERPIILTAATYPNNLLRFFINVSLGHDPIKDCIEMGDIVGLNVYPVVGYKVWGKNVYIRTKRSERDQYFSKLFNSIREKGKDVWIVELQAEPWEPGHLAYKEKEQSKTASPQETRAFLSEFRELKVNTILLWGAEYWIFRSQAHGDDRWIKAMRGLIKGYQ